MNQFLSTDQRLQWFMGISLVAIGVGPVTASRASADCVLANDDSNSIQSNTACVQWKSGDLTVDDNVEITNTGIGISIPKDTTTSYFENKGIIAGTFQNDGDISVGSGGGHSK